MAATEIGLGCSFLGSPEYVAPDALEDVFNGEYNTFHKASPSDDLFSFGLVILFIISGTRSEEIVHYYAVNRLLLCTRDVFPVLRECRHLFARMMRHYYESGAFHNIVKFQPRRLRIEGLHSVMSGLLKLRASARLTLANVFECDLFKAARKLSAERNAMVVHYKEQARVEQERAKQLAYSAAQAQAEAATLQKELSELRVEQANTQAENKRVSAQLVRNGRAPSRKELQRKELELEQSKAAHQAELEALKTQLEQKTEEADTSRRRAEKDASERARQLEAALAEKAQYAGAVVAAQFTVRTAKDQIETLRDRVHELELDKARTEIDRANVDWFMKHPEFAVGGALQMQQHTCPEEAAPAPSIAPLAPTLIVETALQAAGLELGEPAEVAAQPHIPVVAPEADPEPVESAAGSENEAPVEQAVVLMGQVLVAQAVGPESDAHVDQPIDAVTESQVDQAVCVEAELQAGQAVGPVAEVQFEQSECALEMNGQPTNFAVTSDQIAEAGAALDQLISGFHEPMPHEMGPVVIPDDVFAALDLEASQQAVLSAAPSPVSVAPLLLPVAPLVTVAPEFENRMSSIEMQVSNMHTEMHKMSEMMERFMSGTAATSQSQPAAQLPVESDPLQSARPSEQRDEQQQQPQPAESVRRSGLRVRKNRGGKAPRPALTKRALRRAQLIDSSEDEQQDAETAPHSSRSRSPAVKTRRGNSSKASESERLSGARKADTEVADSEEDDDDDDFEMDQSIEVPRRGRTRGNYYI